MIIMWVIIRIIGPTDAQNFNFCFKNHQYYSDEQISDVFQLIDCTNMVWIDGARRADHRRGHIDTRGFFNWRDVTVSVIYITTSRN